MEVAIIMGAGPAGLTAAYELLTKTDIKPIIIEADKQIGGLSKTINYKGNLIDIGGHRFFSKSQKIIDWWLQFLPLDESYETRAFTIHYRNQASSLNISPGAIRDSENFMLVRPRKSRIYYKHHFFDYPLTLTLKTIRQLGFRKTAKIFFSYVNARLFPEKPELTLAQFFKNRFGKELYKTFFKDYTEKVWGVSCEEIPSDWGKQRIKDLNIWKAIAQSFKSALNANKSLSQKGVSTSLIEQFLYPQKGPGQMWEAVAKKIIELGGEIHLLTSVENIIAKNENKILSVTCKNLSNGDNFNVAGDYFFSTIPIKELISGLQGVDINKNIRSIAASLEYRDFLIVGLLMNKKNIRDKKNNPASLTDNWIYLQDKGIRAGRIQIFNNWSPHMVTDPDNIWMGVEYFCKHTDEFWRQPDETTATQAINEMERIGLINAGDVTDHVVIKVLNAYPSYTGSYNNFEALKNFVNGFDNLFLIGRNGMHRYNNSDHSMMTAMIAVENIIRKRKNKENIWEVNLDEGYHEEL